MRAIPLLISTIAIAACNMVADAQESASGTAGPITQRQYNLAGFDAVSLGGPYDVVVQVGPAASVRAEGPADELERMRLEVENGSLKIERDRKWKIGGRSRPVTVYVTMPSIRAASIGGSGDMRIDQVRGERFAASIGGSGDMQIGAMEVADAKFSVAGSGDISASGSAGRTDISIAGSGDVRLGQLRSRDAAISIVGSGAVQANATETANVSIMGSGDVVVSGQPRCNVNKMGSGSVQCGA